MQVIIDNRETRSKVPKILEKILQVKYCTLPTGDYQISDDIIFERKTFNDWEGSVMDGRIFKQAERLKEEFKTPVFILEGGPKYGGPAYSKPKLTKAALHSSMLSIGLGFGIPIIPSNNPTETANIIIQAVRRLDKDTKIKHVQTHKKGKTLKEQRMQVFLCFPGIGPKLANSLAELKFPLIEILKAIETVEVDKLGPKKIKAIQEVLYSVDV